MGTRTESIGTDIKGPRVFLHTLQNLNRSDKTEYNAAYYQRNKKKILAKNKKKYDEKKIKKEKKDI